MSVIQQYTVGSNQIDKNGDQSKLFVSKSTLIYSFVNCYVRFNNVNNVPIVIMANTWYEFKTNIHQVFWWTEAEFSEDNLILFYFEGVLPEEARRPE